MNATRSRVIICAPRDDAEMVKDLARSLRAKGNLVWHSEWELESIESVDSLSIALNSWTAEVSHFIALLTVSNKDKPEWASINKFPQATSPVVILASPAGQPVPPLLDTIKNSIAIPWSTRCDIAAAILQACPELNSNPKDSEGWYKHIESTYKIVSDYDRHYSTVRSGTITFLLTFSYYMAALFLKDATTPEALLASVTLPILFLALACLLSSYFQQQTYACGAIEKDLDKMLEVVTNPGLVGKAHLSFRTLLDNKYKTSKMFFPDFPNIALWFASVGYCVGVSFVITGLLCPEDTGNMNDKCVDISAPSSMSLLSQEVFNWLLGPPVVFGILVFGVMSFQIMTLKMDSKHTFRKWCRKFYRELCGDSASAARPTKPGRYRFQQETILQEKVVEVCEENGYFTVKWSDKVHPVEDLKGRWQGPLPPPS